MSKTAQVPQVFLHLTVAEKVTLLHLIGIYDEGICAACGIVVTDNLFTELVSFFYSI